MFRNLAGSITGLTLRSMCATNPLLLRISGYDDVPKDWTPVDGYPYEFLQAPAGDDVHVIDTDVVIVGSGPGGGVCAKNLAEAGHRVLVVDKGYYFPPSAFPMTQVDGGEHLFEGHGAVMNGDGNVFALAGATWGGGGTVNWSVCLRTQDFVRDEWAKRGLPLFASKQYDDCMDRVWDFVGASTDGVCHGRGGDALLDGSKALGWKAGPVAQNTSGREHRCGRCIFGCGLGEKNGPATSWLPAAAESGAEFMEGFKVEKVVFGDDGVTATGVEGEWLSRGPGGDVNSPKEERTRRRIRVKAKRVIVSAGTLMSPLVLMRSGIDVGLPRRFPWGNVACHLQRTSADNSSPEPTNRKEPVSASRRPLLGDV